MATPFLSEISIFPFNFPPKGMALCNGQLLPINQNQALFSLMGTTYGGDGRVNFGLPDLRGKIPFHFGSGHTIGETAGEYNHTLSIAETPQHNHLVSASSGPATVASPVGGFFSSGGQGIYSSTPTTALAGAALSSAGGSQSHNNMPPYLVLNFCITLVGIFPSQN